MRFNKIPKKWIAVLSACIVLLCYGVACVFGHMTYHTNDDVTIQDYICAFSFDGLWWVPPWISIFLSYPLGLLSHFVPQVSWWYVASLFFVAVSLFAVHYIALRLTQIKNVPLWITLVFLAIFDSIFNVYSIAEIAFTIVPVVVGGGLAALAYYYPFVSSNKRKCILGFIFIGLVIAISHRWESGTIASAFLLVVAAMVFSEMHGLFSRKMIVNMVTVSIVIGVTVLGISSLNTVVNTYCQGEEWMRYSPARASWKDYSHDSYTENPELYNAAGWTEDTYNFASKWIFLSDEITEESFRYLAENSESNHRNISLVSNLKNAIRRIVYEKRIFHTVLMTVLVCGFIFILKLYEKDWNAVLFLIADMLLGVAITMYLCVFVGRVIYRTVAIIMYPTTIIAIFIFISSYQNNIFKVRSKTFLVGLMIVLVFLPSSFYHITQKLDNKDLLQKQEYEQLTLAKYESENRDKTFIYQGYAGTSYRRVSTDPIDNAYCMGGSLWRSNFMKHFQEVNNIDQFNWTVFELPHVYFLGRLNEDTAYIVDYLQREYHCKGVAVVEPIEKDYDIYCLKFVYEDNLADYASFYTVVDGSFVEYTRWFPA